ncbi:LanC-like protein 2 [Merluccius polli]|uniref:LanC-like protein 2 n=1 Tax=Merluccius polli TaxID=89951 RepID=A0AA47ML50_MERPO|nr:LanC-like protein 2 [Merluccius polli]
MERCPLLYEWHRKQYVGAAHGLAGIYYMLMQLVTETMEDCELIKRYRLNREGIKLVELVRDAITSPTNRNNPISPEIKCLATLRYLATGKMQLCNADDLGISQPSFIRFPLDNQQLHRIKANFMAIAGMPGVVGAIDGTHIKIIAPSKDEDVFVNRKKVHSINTQIVFDATFYILDVVAKWPGSTHDSCILMESGLRQDVALDTLSQSTTGSTVKRELSRKAKLSIYQSIYVPALTYGHELWVMTERTRSRVQAAEMSFLRRVAGLSLRDRVRSLVIREELGVDPLLLRVERSQMRWLGHLVRMPPGRLPGEVFRARPTGRRPRGRPSTRWRDYSTQKYTKCCGEMNWADETSISCPARRNTPQPERAYSDYCMRHSPQPPGARVDADLLSDVVRPSVDYVRHKRFRSGNYPSSLSNESDRLIHWCHGAPGVVPMLLMAYKVFKEDKYLKDAVDCGEVIWQRGLLRKGYGICHGTAGNGYAFLSLYRLTQDKKYLYRACKFAEWCLEYGTHGCRIPDRPYSLFEGMAGAIHYLSEMAMPGDSCFPAFEL